MEGMAVAVGEPRDRQAPQADRIGRWRAARLHPSDAVAVDVTSTSATAWSSPSHASSQ